MAKLIAQHRKSIGRLELEVGAPETTRLWVDGTELRDLQLRQALPLNADNRVLIYTIGRSAPVVKEITIIAGVAESLHLPKGVPTTSFDSVLGITCNTPDVSVSINGRSVAHTPLTRPLLVASGKHQLSFARLGYRTTERVVHLERQVLFGVALIQTNATSQGSAYPFQNHPYNSVAWLEPSNPSARFPLCRARRLASRPLPEMGSR